MEVPLITVIISTGGIILSQIIAQYFIYLNQKIKLSSEAETLLINKKLASAEAFVKIYPKYLTSIQRLAHALSSRDYDTQSPEALSYLDGVIDSCLEEINQINEDTESLSLFYLYFDTDTDLDNTKDSINFINLHVEMHNAIHIYKNDPSPENAAKKDETIIKNAQYFKDFALQRQHYVEGIRNALKNDLTIFRKKKVK